MDKTVEKSDLAKQFDIEYEKFQKEIEECVNRAKLALWEAVEISEKYGFPFSKGISFVYNNYVPESFDKKWGKLLEENEYFCEDHDIYLNEYNDYGWRHSSTIC